MSTTFAPAENSTFALNGWFMHTQSHIYFLELYIHIARSRLAHGAGRATYKQLS